MKLIQVLRKNKTLFISVFVFAIVSTITLASNRQSFAAPVTGFNAGSIIDDGVFTDAATMDAGQIQTFLNSKVPTCDTNGTQTSEFGGGTRAQWAAARGYSGPFTCLKDYTENGKTSAQIISDTATQYQINPQVLIVVLQKEQGLVTDTWPLSSQYKTATGYGCPDSAGCDSQYFGLTNQLQWTAKMYRAIMNTSPNWYTPYILGNNSIKWSPDSNCGSSVVNIQNRATQALYNYTPYQPNQAALSAGYGNGDSCSSYGNRNFYLYFSDWFGSVRAINGSIVISHALTTSISTVSTGDTVNAWFQITNNSNIDVNAGGFGICARLNGANYDFGFVDKNLIPANGTITLSYNKQLNNSGTLNLFICSYSDALGGWASAQYPYNASPVLSRSLTYTVADNPLITTDVALSPTAPAIGQLITANITLHNSSNTPINIGSLEIAGRSPTGANIDFPLINDVIIPAGGDYTYSKSRVFTEQGQSTFYVANWNGVWTTAYPKSTSASIQRSISVNVKDNPLLTTSVTLSPSTLVSGQAVTATVTLHNASTAAINIGSFEIAGRSPTGINVDFPLLNDVIIPAGGDYVYTQSRSFTQKGTYSFYVANWNGVWTTAYPKSESNSVLRNITATVN
jgi:hypothetical protein